VRGEAPLLDAVLPVKQQPRTERFTQLALIAANEALTQAGLSNTFPADRYRFGAYLGIGVGGVTGLMEADAAFKEGGPKRVNPFVVPKIITSMAPGWLSMQFNIQGPTVATASACASSADALGLAFRSIRDGYTDYMLAGGSEACALPLTLASFGNMRALSTWQGDAAGASRPFDKERSGFVLAEGAAVLVLERLETAVERGATIIAELVGYGATADAYHMTAMHPDGNGAVAAISLALADAGITPEQVGYINAHGTATPMNDAQETMVLKKVFKEHVQPETVGHAVVSSTKSMTGHMLGAAGAAEAAFCALALRSGVVPPTINLQTPDAACDLDYVPNVARQHVAEYAISNSFGFGGCNSVLVLKRF
jgi:3-oxoacyl-[acyl-carrier-protein] synthase II